MGSKTHPVNFIGGSLIRPMLRFAAPVFLCDIFQLLYNTADTIIIGHTLGDASLAAIGSSAVIFEIMMALVTGFTTGLSIVIARNYGTGDRTLLRRSIAASLTISCSSVILITALGYLLLRPMLRLINTPEEIYHQAYEYISLIVLFSGVTMVYNLLAGMLRAIGNSFVPLLFLIVASCLNIALDLLFIVAFGAGVQGAAIATVISQGMAAIGCLIYILSREKDLIPEKTDFRYDRQICREAVLQSISLSMMKGIVVAGGAILQAAINGMGTLVVAGHTAARRIFMIFLTLYDAINVTISTVVSQNRGANHPERIRKAVIICYKAVTVVTLAVTAILHPGAEYLVHLISGSSERVVLENASAYLRFVSPCYFILGILNISRVSLQALGQKILPVVSSVIELIGKILFVWLLIPVYGYRAVIACEPIIWVAMVAELLPSFWLNPYIRKREKHPDTDQ